MGLRTFLGLRNHSKLRRPLHWKPVQFQGHRPPNAAELFDASFERRIDIVKLLKPGWIGVELGVARGEFSEALLANSDLGFLYSIDMWAGDRGHDVRQYCEAIARLDKVRTRNAVLKLRFDEALPLFPDSHFDFIYIDGYAHTGEEQGQTLQNWWPKLKLGGLFAGDDYSPNWPAVMDVVDAFLEKKSHHNARFPAFDANLISAFNESDSLRRLYRECISVAQNGRHDNLNKQLRYYILAQIAEHAAATFPDLDFAECGCFFGHSTHMLARILQARSPHGDPHVFDLFEGLSEFSNADVSPSHATPETHDKVRRSFASDYDQVANGLAAFDFVHLYKGWIPERFAEVSDHHFSFVSVDVDLQQPTRDSIEFFFPRLSKGGFMYFDDYGYNVFPGATSAVDEFLVNKDFSFFLRMPFGSAVLQK